MARRKHFTWLLWFLCLGLLGGLLWFVKPAGVKVPLQNSAAITPESHTAVAAETSLLGANLTGQNSTGETWRVSAETVLGQGTQTERVQAATLRTVQAFFAPSATPQNKNWQLKAPRATYKKSANSLLLSEGVSASGHGFCLQAPTLAANLKQETLRATSPVKIWGSAGDFRGDIRSQRFRIAPHQSGIKMQLSGGVTMTFHGKKGQTCAL